MRTLEIIFGLFFALLSAWSYLSAWSLCKIVRLGNDQAARDYYQFRKAEWEFSEVRTVPKVRKTH